jgi:hypothetical protein
MDKYKYDLEFIIPVCFKPKYLERFRYFAKKGISNIENHKILINFLVGQEQMPDDFYSFADNVEVRIIKSELNHETSKLYDFYYNYKNFDQSKWIVKMDDDSFTNVDGLIRQLEIVSPNKEYYFVGQQTTGSMKVTIDILAKHNLLRKLHDHEHEVEIAVISNEAYKNTIENYRDILKERSKIEAGYTDQLFCLLAKTLGIFPIKMRFLTASPMVNGFIREEFAHIHGISYDKKCGNLFDIFWNIINLENKEICKCDFLLVDKNNNEVLSIKLLEKGLVGCNNSTKIHYWNFDDISLILYSAQGHKLHEFTNFNIEGKNSDILQDGIYILNIKYF